MGYLVHNYGCCSVRVVLSGLVLFVIASCNYKCALASGSISNQQSFEEYREVKKLARLDTADFVRYYGYPCESHDVITTDDYILTMHHIPYGKVDPPGNTTKKSKPVVFLQHGLFSYSGDWFLMGPEKALGLLLADAGYDVWVGNARGNKHSRDHLIYDPNIDDKFWDFSWHEIGYYDLPAMIDHILNQTNQEKLFYIGHSQGTTVYYVMLSERPEYNEKIIAQFSLSPIAFVSNLKGPVLKLIKYAETVLEFVFDVLKVRELAHNNMLFNSFCTRAQYLCIRELFLFVGSDPDQFNATLLPIILANYPAGSSVKQLKHFGQGLRRDNFAQYNYGRLNNIQVYGDVYPPNYDLSNVEAPIYLFCSGNDYLSALEDVKRLYWALPDGNKYLWKVDHEHWNHIDYVWGIQAKEFVYDKIINIMEEYISL